MDLQKVDSGPVVIAVSLVSCLVAGGARSKTVVVPLKESQGHPTIELRINRKGPYRFSLDTGSGAELIVNEDLAVHLGLEAIGTRRIGDPNAPDAIEAKTVKVARVDLGDLSLQNIEAISWKRETLRMPDVPRGVVGLGLFGPRLVTLDYGRGKLIVEAGDLPGPDGQAVIAASFEDGIPSVTMDVAGVTFRAHVDSGSTGFVGLPLDAAERLPLDAPPVVVGRARTASGDYAVTEARLRGSVRIGGIVIENPKLRFVDLPIGNVGFDLLRSLVVTFDRKNQRVRLVRTGAPLAPSERTRLGIVLQGKNGGRIPIVGVSTGSPAEAAGVRAGDQIVSLNGRAVSAMSAYELSVTLQARPLAIALFREQDGMSTDRKERLIIIHFARK